MTLPRLAVLASCTAAFAGAAHAQAPSSAAASLVPHRAVYELTLDGATEATGISGLSGRMVYEFNGSACEGYTTSFRFVTRIAADQSARVTDQQTTTFEAGDGSEYSFLTRSYIDQALDKEIRGSATLDEDATRVAVELPEPADYTLARSQFPTQHLIEVLDKAAAGETFYETTVYDGSDDGEKVMTTTVILGQPTTLEEGDREVDALDEVADEAFRPVDVAYFDTDGSTGEEMPTYRISFKLYESGVTRDLTMDYGDFTIDGRLVDLVLFDAPADCPD